MQQPEDGGTCTGTSRARVLWAPLAVFVRAETRGALLLVAAAVAALVWAGIDDAGYEAVWTARGAVQLGSWQVSMPLREWVNSGLMALFFFVVG